VVEAQVTNALRQHFRPEFLNRVDDIIIFRPLAKPEIEHIIDLQLGRLEKLLSDRKLTFELTPAAREILATEGYDPAFGARPLKRAIQRLLQNPLALAVLEGKFSEGDHIVVDRDPKGELTFRKASESALAGR
jgi:ATP-dependent Clp protease ATP-binding subunit ClpB